MVLQVWTVAIAEQGINALKNREENIHNIQQRDMGNFPFLCLSLPFRFALVRYFQCNNEIANRNLLFLLSFHENVLNAVFRDGKCFHPFSVDLDETLFFCHSIALNTFLIQFYCNSRKKSCNPTTLLLQRLQWSLHAVQCQENQFEISAHGLRCCMLCIHILHSLLFISLCIIFSSNWNLYV